MSALRRKADVAQRGHRFRLVPKAGVACAKRVCVKGVSPCYPLNDL
jgi:hypothetical protein